MKTVERRRLLQDIGAGKVEASVGDHIA